MNKIKRKAKPVENAKYVKLEISGRIYEFQRDIFGLESHNIGILSEQICEIPGQISWIGQVLGEAERELAKLTTARDMWLATKARIFDKAKSETAKLNEVRTQFGPEYIRHADAVADSAQKVALLKAYKNGMEAKYNLSQTLSANIRLERESWAYRGQKGPRQLNGQNETVQ